MEAALPGYEVGEQIGQGGFGLVFAARHRQLNAARAIKAVVLPDVDAHAVSARFLTEAQVMTELDHPHLVRVFEYAEHEELRLLVMEYLTGGTLATRVQRGAEPVVACAWALAVADGLQAAHERGIVHRDVKPENVLFTADGVPKVCDFGIAKLFDNSMVSASAGFMGTPMYVSPEQIRGERVGPGTDIYALGVTLYQLLTRRTPFPKTAPVFGLIQYHLHEPPAPMDEAPPAVAAVVRRALAKDRSDRPASAREFAQDLARAAHQDFGPDWIDRAGVPLRVHHSLLRDSTTSGGSTQGKVAFETRSGGHRRGAGAAGSSGAAVPGTGPDPASPVTGPGAVGDGTNRPSAPVGTPGRRTAALAVACGAAVLVLAAGTAYGLNRSHVSDAGASTPTPGTSAVAVPSAAKSASASPDPTPARTSTPVQRATTPVRRLLTLTGFDGALNAVAFSPNGTLLAGAASDGTIRLWNTSTGAPVGKALTGHTGPVNTVAFSPDGTRLATAGDDRTIRLWNLSTGTQVGASFTGHTAGIGTVAFSPDGTRLASGSADTTVRLWSTSTHMQLGPALTGHVKTVRSVTFSPDGTRLASSSNDGTIRRWNPTTGAEIGAPLTGHTSWVESIAFSPDGSKLVSASDDKTLRLWSVATGQQIGSVFNATAPVSAVAFSPDGTRFASGADDHTVRLWSVRGRTQIGAPLTGQTGNLNGVAFSPDGTQLASTDNTGTAILRRLT